MDGFYLCKGNPRTDISFVKEIWNWSHTRMDTAAEVTNFAPNGDSVTKVIPNSANARHYFYRTATSLNYQFASYSTVMYIKPIGEQTRVALWHDHNISDFVYPSRLIFVLTGDGSTDEVTGYEGTAHGTCDHIGDGWYKCVMTTYGSVLGWGDGSTPPLTLIMFIQPTTDETDSYAGNLTDGAYVWKAFSFASDSSEHYFPDITDLIDYPAFTSPYPARSVRFYPTWKHKNKEQIYRFDVTDHTGVRSQYITGQAKKWNFNIPVIESYRAFMVNGWWKEREPIYFYNGIDYTTYQCAIANKSEPFSWAKKPYDNIMKGSLELEVV